MTPPTALHLDPAQREKDLLFAQSSTYEVLRRPSSDGLLRMTTAGRFSPTDYTFALLWHCMQVLGAFLPSAFAFRWQSMHVPDLAVGL